MRVVARPHPTAHGDEEISLAHVRRQRDLRVVEGKEIGRRRFGALTDDRRRRSALELLERGLDVREYTGDELPELGFGERCTRVIRPAHEVGTQGPSIRIATRRV